MCTNEQGYSHHAKRECIGLTFQEIGSDMLVVTETKLKERDEFQFWKVMGRNSGILN